MDFFDVVSVQEAINRLMEAFKEYEFKAEEVSILEATNRILAEDIYSHIDVPEFNRSTVDGYAIKSKDSQGASESVPSLFNILGEVRMGEAAEKEIKSGETMYVPTGGMIPQGADGMVMVEYTEKLDEENLMVYKPIAFNENIILKGDDIRKGERALKRGKRLTPESIGVLAALGISRVKVYKKPKFYIISTGDEIIDLDEELELGKIRDINSYTLYSAIVKLGGEITGKAIVKDDYELLRQQVEKGLDISDIVLISGGSSVGARDYTARVIDSFEGRGVFVHGISIKPGKPTILGEGKGKLIVGLPGHPVSSIIVFGAIIEEFIYKKMEVHNHKLKTKAIMDFNFPSSPGQQTYQMVKLEERDGKTYASPSFGKSGMITLLSNSDGYIIIKPHEEGIYKGEEREVYLL
ncbi:molybdopterin molybdotransferase MoeA [Tepidimicrobium xylanilyticum]|uniref:Molybdopterin molybdenumtransferase n=1 Tax=Tepidimicrobium xylanilyticum TaxID=1123352 RepID=A0A1H3AXT6_9FIRM|nr:molybdopterin molybdotransferase MoeA [Tepidimicrobium xylanilyticum]GMG97676.1 molybdopterin molybdenumtransferase MoeA [Tepidimicrobium xylanilyticum]SDX33934.1 molybdopterin molybdotransferase [Tepidimicrobium xylanilyticum]